MPTSLLGRASLTRDVSRIGAWVHDVSRLRGKECFFDELVLRLKAIEWNWLVLRSFRIELGTSWKLLGHVYNERETTTGDLPNFRDFDCLAYKHNCMIKVLAYLMSRLPFC
jgi:hypothetical protein